jgi:type VI secretion system secreted protein VgrG
MPINPIDANRALMIHSPLGEDLICRSFSGQETLGRLFDYRLDLRSLNRNIQFEDIVGQRVTVAMELPDGERYFDGFVTEFRYMGTVGQFASYQATVKPWLWFLTRTADCRIFQNQNVPDIIMSVFRDNGMSDVRNELSDSYRDWVYCVQYRETDFNFLSRLMEQEGIYYYFEHILGKHTLVLADGQDASEAYPGYEVVPFFPPDPNAALRERDHLQHVSLSQGIVPGSYAIKDFDFEKPRVDLSATFMEISLHAYPIPEPEIFDYPGEFDEVDDGETCVDKKLQELQAQHERVQAGGNARGMCTGYLFTLENYPRHDLNKEYLIISVTHHISSDALETSGGAGAEGFYSCQLEVMDSSRQYRSERSTAKPVVQGLQTAIVVGPPDEEIYCDEYARVKVQFHWDRYGENDQNSSCWMRVSQLWAGKKWGGIHIPRIGQEVLISFLEGDPDRPLITGRVYNADQMPPYDLPGNKTQSGIKSRSSEGGNPRNFNEIRMEDKIGDEELYINAEKNHTNITENDRNENVGPDRSLHVGHDKSEKVVNNKKIDVDGTHTETIIKETKVTVTEGNYTHDVVEGTETRHVGGLVTETFDDSQGTTVANNIGIIAQNGFIHITAKTDIQLHVGDSLMIMKKDGTISISGKDILVSGSNKVSMGVGSQNVTCDKQKVASAGAAINSSAVGMHEITGAVVKIN